MTTFYCKDSPTLRVGDDTAEEVRFVNGFAEIPLGSKDYDIRVGWLRREVGYAIEDLGEEPNQVPDGEGEACPVCGRSFATPFALKGHLRSHREK